MAAHTYKREDQHDPDMDDAGSSGDDDSQVERASEDIRRHDLETITAEEEAERLLAGDEKRETSSLGNLFRRDGSGRKGEKRTRRRGRSDVLYKVEQGGQSSSPEESANSSEDDVSRLGQTQAGRKKPKISRFGRFAAVHVVILVAFLAFAYGAYRASRSTTAGSTTSYMAKTLSNGTHEFAPTTLIISLDGFRADFLHRGLTPTLKDFIHSGVSPKYMWPSFPSLTFPNHFTLVTGLHPESHGIVGNTFWDPGMMKGFTYGDAEHSMRPEYWNAEPIWETAELQGVRTAIHMWPGSEAHIGTMEPAYVDKYNGQELLDVKVNRILGWLDLPGPNDPGASEKTPRPQLIAAYVPNVDSDGHKYGPNSTYIRSTIAEVDGMLGKIFKGIDERNLTQVVNIVVVSDHGMATTSNDRLIQLEDLVDTSLIEHTDGWPLFGLRPFDKSQAKLTEMYNDLYAKAHTPKYEGKIDIYLRDKNMPDRYHFSNNERIAPLWIFPKAGYAIAPRHEFDLSVAIAKGETYAPRGLHGYDHQHPLMRAIFVARGPAFPHPSGSLVQPFQNTEVYNVLCDSLGIEPHKNNGTMRLPFRTSGVHDLEEAWEDVPDDPPPVPHLDGIVVPPTIPESSGLPEASEKLEESAVPQLPSKTEDDASFNPDAPPKSDTPEQKAGDGEQKSGSWRDWFKEKIEAIKEWASGLFGGSKDAPQTAEETRHGEDWR